MNIKRTTLYLILFNLIFFNYSLGIENKIIAKVNNEIITTIDILDETNFLKVLNPNLISIKDEEIFEIAKNTLIREKIKEIEILTMVNKIYVSSNIYEKFIEANYLRYGFKNLKEFHEKMNKANINLEKLQHKISIEAIWNQIIISKYSSKIIINEKKLREDILKNNNNKKNVFLLHEIIFDVNETSEQQKKFEIISEDILQDGFENAATKHSMSSTNKIGGKIGWIEEDALNKNIKNELLKINVNEFTKPIQIPGGFLILYIQDKKEKVEKIDLDIELKNLIDTKFNQQLNQFSNLHYQKAKKNIIINEI